MIKFLKRLFLFSSVFYLFQLIRLKKYDDEFQKIINIDIINDDPFALDELYSVNLDDIEDSLVNSKTFFEIYLMSNIREYTSFNHSLNKKCYVCGKKHILNNPHIKVTDFKSENTVTHILN